VEDYSLRLVGGEEVKECCVGCLFNVLWCGESSAVLVGLILHPAMMMRIAKVCSQSLSFVEHDQ